MDEENTKTKTLQVVLRPDAMSALKEQAKTADVSVSVFVRNLLESALGIPAFNSKRG